MPAAEQESQARRSYTADVVALARALDFRRPPKARVVADPWAGRFLEAIGSPLVRGRLAPLAAALGGIDLRTRLFIGAQSLWRHRFLDQFLERQLAAFGARPSQVVILGAGLDARAYRFGGVARDALFFEVDHPAFSSRKREVVRGVVGETPHVRFVAADLERAPLAEALIGAGFSIDRPSVFVWEGVTYYLSREAVEGTLTAARMLMAPGSSIGFDLWCAAPRSGLLAYGARAASQALMRVVGEPFRFWLPPSGPTPAVWLAGLGYRDVQVTRTAALTGLAALSWLEGRLGALGITVVEARP